ncbi:RpnC/YadD family protein [Nocardiopsis suaedae]|uniref:DUF4351 domain-containing protein n=1 Tax=Nocardiopsis suaedae TaxID=3018444 RepID=A0ABT4TQ26_9ACTN|nr:hypothetical protein [Nocardiopsis suaedae]MDA2806788.1 hypothetical protein [Nocardiopsis suaedae]
MPKIEHEFLTELFQNDPNLVVELVEQEAGGPLPRFTKVTLQSNRVNKVDPPEMTADSVVLLRDPEKSRHVHGRATDAVGGIIAEVQRERDKGKRLSWPCYVTNLRYRIDAPVVLLVLCTDRSVARWCRTPIPTGHPRFELTPLTLGPDEVPVVDDPMSVAASPELGMLSTLLHADEDVELVDTLMKGLNKIDPSKAETYTGLAMVLLAEAPRHRLEDIVSAKTYGFTSPFTERYVEQGRTEGRVEGRVEGRADATARMILKILRSRRIETDTATRERITACTDLDTLDHWADRAFTISSAQELFE